MTMHNEAARFDDDGGLKRDPKWRATNPSRAARREPLGRDLSE